MTKSRQKQTNKQTRFYTFCCASLELIVLQVSVMSTTAVTKGEERWVIW